MPLWAEKPEILKGLTIFAGMGQTGKSADVVTGVFDDR